MQISINDLIEWHRHFVNVPIQSDQVKEIITAIERRLHTILTTLEPAPTPNQKAS